MEKHTPGPWIQGHNEDTELVIWTGKAPCVPLARCNCSPGVDHLTGKANARLMATAPDLLKACIAAQAHHQGGHSEIGARLRTAIAKATGGERD